ncbi:Oidioi.mRNA.OKI2018_I69.chr1.g344.t1.cds [Oikopleura dioica]|uniref:Oidioi.mRNA.OKI2018_I69.chr1.g344.t1.cds n=1 Tax=Oikopleura dioica TaxID=34765 RepID=A0ABN7SK17_OIKDI|nr:Oidioi.mRNA.OKI2018_I69.chr1.g344.t1.cds [Oikopleura dioica]
MRRILKAAIFIAIFNQISVDALKSNGIGSDCQCRCKLHEDSREPCPNGKGFQIFFSVEAISSGSDCQCTCEDPPVKTECLPDDSATIKK